MSEARRRDEYDRSAPLTAFIAEANRDRKKKPSPYRISDFHPFEGNQKRGIPITKKNFRLLRQVFVKPHGNKKSQSR